MTNTQLTLVQLDNYGPWTVTPEPRREADLQAMQARLYADVAQFVGSRGGYAFFARFDNMVAVTNGLSTSDHARLQETIRNRYPVTASVGVAAAPDPASALAAASDRLQSAGSAQDERRREALRGEALADAARAEDDVCIAHFDVVNATGKYTDRLDAYASFVHIARGTLALMAHLHERHGGLAFFVGGDNVIAVCPDLPAGAFEDALDHVRTEADVAMQVGVGRGESAQAAGMAAKHALERCRADGERVVGAPRPAERDGH